MKPFPEFRERLWPGVTGWVAVVGAGAFAGIALLPVGRTAAVVAGLAGLALAVVVAVVTSPVVHVHDEWVEAGRARIPARLLGPPVVLDRDGLRAALGPGSDARTFAVLRAWVDGGVLVPVVDPADRTPAWLVSSRRAVELAAAIESARRTDQAAHSEQIG